jgi:hypothetical protein
MTINKKTFIAATIISALLTPLIAGFCSVNSVNANPLPGYNAEITFDNPKNVSYTSGNVTLTFIAVSNYVHTWFYSLDGEKSKPLENVTEVGLDDGNKGKNPPVDRITIRGNCSFTNLSEGSHNVSFSLVDQWQGAIGYSTIATFVIDTIPPKISSVSLENQTFQTKFIPLQVSVDNTASWVGYNIDNQQNLTLYGNLTIAVSGEGLHNVTFYSNDSAGNMGTSFAFFTINTEPSPMPSPIQSISPTPNFTPSSSPTQQSPSRTPISVIADQTVDYTTTKIVLGILALTIAVGAVAYFYFKKNKK